MVPLSELKIWLHKSDLQKIDKLLIILGSFSEPCSIDNVRKRAADAGLKIGAAWNPSASLRASRGKAINTPTGWEITPGGMEFIRALGVKATTISRPSVALDLHNEATRISDSDTKTFIEEAIGCYEHGFFRAAIVMSWLTAVQILRKLVFEKHLAEFNNEARRVNQKWKPAKTTDDLGRMDEAEFLDRLSAISVIGKNVKDELQECLKRRNGCGHPNSLKVRANTVTHHIEILLLNVLRPFS